MRIYILGNTRQGNHSMNVLYLWGKGYKTLSDIDLYFVKIYNLNENEIDIAKILNFLAINQIDMVVIQNPYQNETRLNLYQYLKINRFRVLISDRGALPNSWFFDPNGFNADSSSYDSKYWDKPLSKSKDSRVAQYIKNELNSDKSLEKQGERLGANNLRKKLNIPQEKKILFVPLQRPSDTVIKYFSKNVDNMEHFLKNIVEIQERLKDEWVLIVKKHPLETQRLYENTLFYVEDSTHFKDLIELCDAIVLINSGVGVISMMYEKPVYHFGDAFYSHPLINMEVQSSDDVISSLKKEEFKVDAEKVKRFISYLIDDFYSFGNFFTEEKIMEDNSKRTITTKIDFYKINGFLDKAEVETVLVTDIEFYRADIGNRQRILRVVQYLSKHNGMKILMLKEPTQKDLDLITKHKLSHIIDFVHNIEITDAEKENTKNTETKNLTEFYNHELKVKFNKYLKNHNFKNIIVEYIRLDYLVNDLHGKYTTYIDTHDLMFIRYKAYSQNNDKHHIEISQEDEIAILKQYRYTISIQKNEYNFLLNYSDKEQNILVCHAVDIKDNYLNEVKLKNITFISGPSNFKHMVWFIENVWIYFLDQEDLVLNIHGSVCKKLSYYRNTKNIKLHGYANDLESIYQKSDLVINPVLYGGGLKIKNVEALSNGIPLITTTEGANGIEDGVNYAFLLADTKEEWIDSILSLQASKKLRFELSRNSLNYSKHYFSDDNCYSELAKLLKVNDGS